MSTITAKVDWWADFFHGIVLDLWRAAITEEATAAQATFLEQTFGIRPGSSVLDVPCGNGRLALALAGKGYRLTGVDIASEFIDEARSHDDDIQWICGDMRDLPEDEPFDAAFCWGNSFGYLDDAGNADFLNAVVRSAITRCTSTAHRRASTTLANSTSKPSPMVLKMRPLQTATLGSKASAMSDLTAARAATAPSAT